MANETNKQDDTRKIINIAWGCAIGVVVIWALTFFVLFMPETKQGIFGDMFGAVNALFSGLAFAGLIITLILQRRELALQRDELEQTRNEFVEQNKTMKRQRFENTFFNLMSLHQHITDNLEYECPDGADHFTAKGREVFKKFYLEKDNFDGSRGIKGFVTYAVQELVQRGEKIAQITAIVPVIMMKSVADCTRELGIHTVVSLNPIMVDGTGMCGGCRVQVGDETKFACVDGPEFDGHLVDFKALMSRQRMYRDLEAEEKDHICNIGLGRK
jgi:hypothetical protein